MPSLLKVLGRSAVDLKHLALGLHMEVVMTIFHSLRSVVLLGDPQGDFALM